jgi:flagellar biosynthesis GTPase FlhF
LDNTFEKAYTPKEVNITLEISDSALRKWCLALEKNGYKFIRNDHKQRVFVENDLVVLRHFQNLVKHHNMQLENAAALVVDRFGKGAFEGGTVGVPAKKEEKQPELQRDFMRSFDDKLTELLERTKTQEEINNELLNRLDQQENFNRELVQRLEQQQKYMEERLELRDQKLMESLRESQEVKQQFLQIAASQEEEKKKGFFARLFGK